MSGGEHSPLDAPGEVPASPAAEEETADRTVDVPPERRGRPDDFRLRKEPPRVMRLSRKALAVMGVVTGLIIGGGLIYALQPAHKVQAENLADTTHAVKSDVVNAAPDSYDKVPKLGPPLPGDLGPAILDAQRRGQFAQSQTTPGPTTANATEAQQTRQRLAQEQTAALGSRLFTSGATNGQSPSSAGSAQDAVIPAGGSGGQVPQSGAVAATAGAVPSGQSTGQAAKRAFLQPTANRATVSAEHIQDAVSPYVLQAGSIIPAALITGIRSDLPGQITAQVTQNVYDSPTGRVLLIPQGSRLIGEYDSQVSGGQNRVLLAWDRLILPGGRSILLERQPGADASGFAGLQDKTNYHWGNMLRAAAISTMLGVGTEMATNSNDELVQAFRYGSEDTINQVGKQLIQREINNPPTLTIRPGFPLRVIITRDLVLEPQGDVK
jgi:type IV secretion system protein VirB10